MTTPCCCRSEVRRSLLAAVLAAGAIAAGAGVIAAGAGAGCGRDEAGPTGARRRAAAAAVDAREARALAPDALAPAPPAAELPAVDLPAPGTPGSGVVAAGALPPHRVYPDAGAALADILAGRPRVLGFGELHSTRSGPKATSALTRFREQVLPLVGARASDLVVETWISQGQCGKSEETVARAVPEQTDRPAATAGEIELLANRARALGIQPHALTLRCADYEALLGADGEPDLERFLALITRELLRVTASTVKVRDRQRGARDLILVYGGALHNDLHPDEASRAYSYALELARTVPRFVEVDLYVPEVAEANTYLRGEPWFALLASTGPGRVIRYERGPGSYVLLLERGQ